MWTIRAKLAIIMVLTIAPPMAVLSLVTSRLIAGTLQQQADATLDYVTTQNSVSINRDLSSLQTVVAQQTERLQQAVTAAVAEGVVGDLIAQGRYQEAGARLTSALAPSGSDLITVIGREGRTVARATSPAAYGDRALLNRRLRGHAYVTDLHPLVEATLAGRANNGMLVLAPTALDRELVTRSSAAPGLTSVGDHLRDRVRIAGGEHRRVGVLALAALVPVPDRHRHIQGAAIAARIINNDRDLILRYRLLTNGWAAISLGDTLIAGNLPTTSGAVVGQTLTHEFTAPVLEGGKRRWLGRLDSTGVELNAVELPLSDLAATPVGVLVAASPVTQMQREVDQMQADAALLESRTLLTLLVWLAVGAAISLASAMLAARSLVAPIRQLQEGARRLGEGDFAHRLQVRSGDEFEALAGEFNLMAEHLERGRDQERLAVIGRMASGIAHDIQNALTTIRASAPLLAEEDLPAEQRQEFAAMLVDSIQRIGDMVRDLLEFARGEQAKLELSRTTVDDYLHGLRRALKREFEDGIRIGFSLHCTAPVLLDAARMNRVLFNLAANARDAMGDHGVLTISSRCDGAYAEIRCTDTGPGLAPEIADRLFQPFASFGKTHGTGLGLVICKQIVGAHGGTIEALSEPGQGATFVIRLPVVGARANGAGA